MSETTNKAAAVRPPPRSTRAARTMRPAVFEHEVGIRFNGVERNDVEEYRISEGWVRVPHGRTVDRKGNLVMLKLKGASRPFYR